MELSHLGRLRLISMQKEAPKERGDLDKAIIEISEAVLLSRERCKHMIFWLSLLATLLHARGVICGAPEDLKSSLKYARFIRANFHPLEAFGIPRGPFITHIVCTLAEYLHFGHGDIITDSEEITALSDELLSSDVFTSDQIHAIRAFSKAVTNTFPGHRDKLPLERVIQVLRKAITIILDSRADIIFSAFATCLTCRFEKTHMINDFEEAISIANKLITHHSCKVTSSNSNCGIIKLNIEVTIELVQLRLNISANPEVLEDSIHRLRALIRDSCRFDDEPPAGVVSLLERYLQKRSTYFSVGNSLEPSQARRQVQRVLYLPVSRRLYEERDRRSSNTQYVEITCLIRDISAAIPKYHEITDVESAVERARRSLPLQHSYPHLRYFPYIWFAHILSCAYDRTKRLNYLNEAITAYRGVRKMSTPTTIHWTAGECLLTYLVARHQFLHRRRDFKEIIRLYPELANDGSCEVFDRFKIACEWASTAQFYGHPSMSTAYETAMFLMQETLVFSPTLQIQHTRLTHALKGGGMSFGGVPSDYASHQIEAGQFKQAIEILERGRALIWSEMRGFRTSTDQLRDTYPALADKLADINRRLESVTMSIAQGESEERGDGENGTECCEGMDSVGRKSATQRRLLEERGSLISHIQSLSSFENFLKPPSFEVLNSAAAHGPVIIINQSRFHSHILLLAKGSPPSVISTPPNFYHRANQLSHKFLQVRKEKGLDSKEYDHTLASILVDLYDLVGKPVIERLRQLGVPEQSRVWLYPTDVFCSFPLHAMGPIPSDDGKKLYFMDLYITSYTPTLSALIESRKPRSFLKTLDKPSLLLVAQPDTLPEAWSEIGVIQATETPMTTLVSATATPKDVVERLRDHQFAHFVCHGLLEPGKPFDASFELHGGNLTLLEIVRSQLPAAEFAFLSACHTAELTEGSIADEGLHLVAAMKYCGFRSVVGTMWAMADTDGADLSKHFYKSIFSKSKAQEGVPYCERSAKALQAAVKKLRRKRGMTLERWVNFVHYGA